MLNNAIRRQTRLITKGHCSTAYKILCSRPIPACAHTFQPRGFDSLSSSRALCSLSGSRALRSPSHSMAVSSLPSSRALYCEAGRSVTQGFNLLGEELSARTQLARSGIRSVSVSSQLRMPVSSYRAQEKGTSHTDTYKVYLHDDEGPISPFHDIPLVAQDTPPARTFHVVIEVPRWTNAKMEIDTKSPLNPIVQDQKKGKLRYVANSFPHHGYIWNYGAFPQTWENPNHVDESIGAKGDNDPVDCCEIGHRVANRGDVLEVKVLGALAMVDDGEADWKIIVIDVSDPLAGRLSSLADVEEEMPGFLAATREWFRIYKIPDGKPENTFAFDGEFQGAEFAEKILDETHHYWRQLVGLEQESEDPGKLCVQSVTLEGSRAPLSRAHAEAICDSCADFVDGGKPEESVNTWHYTHLK